MSRAFETQGTIDPAWAAVTPARVLRMADAHAAVAWAVGTGLGT